MIIVQWNSRRRPAAIEILWWLFILAAAGIGLPRVLEVVTEHVLTYLGW